MPGARRPPILYASTICSSSFAAERAVFRSPAAIAISTCAGRRRRRAKRLLGIVERAGDSRDRGVDLPLGEAEQGEARLRVEPELVRRSVRLVRSGEVAEPTADLADLVVPARP